MSLSEDALAKAKRQISKNGGTFINLYISVKKLKEIIDNERDVTSVFGLE